MGKCDITDIIHKLVFLKKFLCCYQRKRITETFINLESIKIYLPRLHLVSILRVDWIKFYYIYIFKYY